MNQPRVTLQQIATRAGVHVTTVSRALRDSPRLPPETKAELQALAKTMGYVPDPALSALIAYRTGTRAPIYQGTIAWFNGSTDRNYVRSIKTMAEYFSAATERASELGYKLEEFWLFEPHLTAEGLLRHLRARGITGILVFPLVAPTAIPHFAWHEFSAVTIGYSLIEPQLNRVTNHQFRTALILFRELCRLGYKRIGLSVLDEHDRRFNLALSACFGAYECRIPVAQRVPIHFQAHLDDRESFCTWLEETRPDAVVSHNTSIADWVKTTSLVSPRDVGLAFINLNADEETLSGAYQSDRQVGRSAVDRLVHMMNQNERGVPQVATHLLVDGVWLARKTTRKVGPPADWPFDLLPSDPSQTPLMHPAAISGGKTRTTVAPLVEPKSPSPTGTETKVLRKKISR